MPLLHVCRNRTRIKGELMDSLREQIKNLAAQRTERGCFPLQMARLLRSVHNNKTHRDWGYWYFSGYVQKELGWPRSRAYHLMHLLNEFEHLGFTEREITQMEQAVGWGKLVDVLPIINSENKGFVLYKVQTLTQRELRKFVRDSKLLMGIGAAA